MTMQQAVLLAAIVGIVAYFLFARGGDISSAEARKLVEAGARLVDVRSPGEFAEGHIAGAVNIPVQGIEGRLKELEPLDRPVVLYCRSGARSSRAAQVLKGAGFAKVHNLGAMSRW